MTYLARECILILFAHSLSVFLFVFVVQLREQATQLNAVGTELARVSAAARRTENSLARTTDANAGLRCERGALERGAVTCGSWAL